MSERQAQQVHEAEPVRRERSPLTGLAAFIGVVIGGAYLLNPTFGIFELIPDNAPFIGNLDEAAATTLLVLGIQRLGALLRR